MSHEFDVESSLFLSDDSYLAILDRQDSHRVLSTGFESRAEMELAGMGSQIDQDFSIDD